MKRRTCCRVDRSGDLEALELAVADFVKREALLLEEDVERGQSAAVTICSHAAGAMERRSRTGGAGG